ncbi:unnamed protein product [Discula destructiva]
MTPPGSRRVLSEIGVRFISDEVKRDHRDLEMLYKGLIQAVDSSDDEAAMQLQNQYSWELARHLIAMQLFVFPGTEQRADGGNSNALKRREELAVIRDHLLHFVDLQVRDADFRPSCAALNDAVRQHIKNVERTDLVAIERALEGDESERMARDWENVGNFMPGDGREPPFRTIEALLGARYDEVVRAWEALPKKGVGIIESRE